MTGYMKDALDNVIEDAAAAATEKLEAATRRSDATEFETEAIEAKLTKVIAGEVPGAKKPASKLKALITLATAALAYQAAKKAAARQPAAESPIGC